MAARRVVGRIWGLPLLLVLPGHLAPAPRVTVLHQVGDAPLHHAPFHVKHPCPTTSTLECATHGGDSTWETSHHGPSSRGGSLIEPANGSGRPRRPGRPRGGQDTSASAPRPRRAAPLPAGTAPPRTTTTSISTGTSTSTSTKHPVSRETCRERCAPGRGPPRASASPRRTTREQSPELRLPREAQDCDNRNVASVR